LAWLDLLLIGVSEDPTGSLQRVEALAEEALCALMVVGQAGDGGDGRCERRFGGYAGNRQAYLVT